MWQKGDLHYPRILVPTRWLIAFTITIVLVTHAGLLLGSIHWNFLTTDEIGHVHAGITYWESGEFGVYPINPPLMKMVAAAPILIVRPKTVSHQLSTDNLPESFDLVRLARLSGVLLSLLGAWVIYRWGRELYGRAAGCFGVILWCFEPSVLAHASLATLDIPATVAGLWAMYGYWLYLRSPSWSKAWLAGIFLGVALLTKFTLLVFYGIWPALWLIYRPGRGDRNARHVARGTLAAQALLMFVLSVWIINVGYEFQGTGRLLSEYYFRSGTFVSVQNFVRRWFGDLIVPLPADFVAGIDRVRRGFEAGQPSYLAGQWRDGGGWWYYYLYALAVKEPLGLWGLVCWGLVLTLASHAARVKWRDEAILWIPAVSILALVSSQSGFNKHMRYVLPALPYVVISTSKLAALIRGDRWRSGLLVLVLLLWSVGSSLVVYPHSLSYFNEAAGGPENGHDHLVDSNIDWGQDLLFLKTWLDNHREARPLGMALYQRVDPRQVGIEFSIAPPGPNGHSLDDPEALMRIGPLPGYYAVSVNFLRGKLYSAPDGEGGRTKITRHDHFAYFRHFRPVARAGYSIYIYRITRDDANAVRRRLGLPEI